MLQGRSRRSAKVLPYFTPLLLLCLLQSASAAQDSLRALAFNAGLLSFLNYNIVPLVGVRTRAMPQVVGDEARRENLDLIALEEVWSDRTANAIRKVLEPLGYRVLHNREKLLYGSGLVLAVKAPWHLESARFVPFRRTTSAELVVKKGFILAHLKSPSGTSVLVVHTHMQAIQFDRRGNAVRGTELNTHKAQSLQIETALNEAASQIAPTSTDPAQVPRLLIGDLNAGPDAGLPAYIQLVDAQGWHPPQDLLLRTWDPVNPLVNHSHVANQNPAMIDHCLIKAPGWVSGKISLTLTEPLPGIVLDGQPVPPSDHFGLLCELELEARN